MKVRYKKIKGYEDRYIVGENGKVKSLRSDGTYIELKPHIRRNYLTVTLYNEFGAKKFPIHRLVAILFLPNPNNLPQVNHKDENKLNNHVSNLEWCTSEYNLKYGTRLEKISKAITKRNIETECFKGVNNPKARKVYCNELNKVWDYIRQAENELGFKEGYLGHRMKQHIDGKIKTLGKYNGIKLTWKYVD